MNQTHLSSKRSLSLILAAAATSWLALAACGAGTQRPPAHPTGGGNPLPAGPFGGTPLPAGPGGLTAPPAGIGTSPS